MIKYETTENKYLYNSKTLEQIIDLDIIIVNLI